jgi:anti-sigma B factor antagonist
MPTTLSTSAEHRDGIETLLVSGEIDLSTAPRLGRAIEAAAVAGVPLVLDLTGVDFIDSTGARVLAVAERSMAEQGSDLLIVPSEFVARVFEIAGLEEAFHVYAGLAEADAAARGRGEK